jgi:bifunctional DNA-binding transcriptional regulator/antitoxin component of YhaV-PrlF toxin-antitoxin module
MMVIFTEKIYNNQKGYFYIPVIWRDEFNLHSGSEVGIDIVNNNIIIDRIRSRTFTQKVSAKGKLTIPYELRKHLSNKTYDIIIMQKEEKILLTPKVS